MNRITKFAIPQTLLSRVWFLHKPSETWFSQSLGVATQRQIIEYSPNTVNETRANVVYQIIKGESGFAAARRDMIATKYSNPKIETEQLRCESCLELLTIPRNSVTLCNTCLAAKGGN